MAFCTINPNEYPFDLEMKPKATFHRWKNSNLLAAEIIIILK
jgi:hypothetical protein